MSTSLGVGRRLFALFATAVLVAGTDVATAGAEPLAHTANRAASPSSPSTPDPSLPTTKQPWADPPPPPPSTAPDATVVTPPAAPPAPRGAHPDAAAGATPVIIDTDIYSGVDDAGALAVANALQDNGTIDILGVLVNNPSAWGASAVSAIDTYYHHDIPVGSVKPASRAVPELGYAKYLAQHFPNEYTDASGTPLPDRVPEAASLYRKLLTNAADHSVVLVNIGYETNLSNLLQSPAGSAGATLSGVDLVAQKVEKLVMMGGVFPNSQPEHGPEHNWAANLDATKYVLGHWPSSVPVEFDGYNVGNTVYTGAGLAQTPDTNPVKAAYARMIDPGRSESSFDPSAMYYAALGAGNLFGNSPAGWPTITDAEGNDAFVADPSAPGHYLVKRGSDAGIAAAIEPLMDQLPKQGPPPPADPIAEHYRNTPGLAGILGTPVGSEQPIAGGAVQHYQLGNIYWSQGTGAWSVHGAILAHYLDYGGPAGILGFPTTDETGTKDGEARYNTFAGAGGSAIYWTPRHGAHEIQGNIYDHWQALGGEAGVLGYPITDERGTPDGIGRYNHFIGPQHDGDGSIYWTYRTGAHAVYGAIRATWRSLGWERSRLGYPLSDEYGIPAGRRNDFQHGQITWNASTWKVTVRYY